MNELEPLIIEDLVVEKPIIQGEMGVGISLYKLAGAVVKAGGTGIIPIVQIGFREPDFTTNFMEASVRPIHREMRLAREIAPQGATGLSIMVATKHYGMRIREAVKAGTSIIMSGAGPPVPLPECVEAACVEMKEGPARGIKLASIASSAKSTIVICKMWDRECYIVLDLVVVEEPLTGGRLESSLDQLSTYGADTTDVPTTYDWDTYNQEVKAVTKVIEECGDKHGRHTSAVTAGDIYTHEDMMHRLELGVNGIQVATRLITTEEYDASDVYKQAYMSAGREGIVITQGPAGIPGGAILNPFLSRIKGGSRPAVGPCFQCLEHRDIRTIPYCIIMALVNAAEGDTDHDLLFCGNNAYRAEKIDAVDNVMRELIGELA